MNDEARDLLIAAHMRGHKQARRVFHDRDGGECPLGLLHVVVHGGQSQAIECIRNHPHLHPNQGMDCVRRLCERFEISKEDWHDIIEATDGKGWDYLTIARKIGVDT
jgi:hypothetical protein